MVDEAEMWQQYDRMKELGGLDPSNPSYGHDDRCDSRGGRNGRADYWNNRSTRADYLSTSHRYKRAHMDDAEERGSHSVEKTSTYWTRQLEKLESSDPNRFVPSLCFSTLRMCVSACVCVCVCMCVCV